MKQILTILFFGIAAAISGENQDARSVIYSPVGKRDPFKAPIDHSLMRELATINPLEKFNLEQLQLKAILKGIGKHRAMFEDPEGKTHILTEGTVLGRERATISRILDREVILTLRTFNYLGAENLSEKIIFLPQEEEDNTDVVPVSKSKKSQKGGEQ
jgi:hypothetical protein